MHGYDQQDIPERNQQRYYDRANRVGYVPVEEPYQKAGNDDAYAEKCQKK
jgi:hypothetical protein